MFLDAFVLAAIVVVLILLSPLILAAVYELLAVIIELLSLVAGMFVMVLSGVVSLAVLLFGVIAYPLVALWDKLESRNERKGR